MKKEGRAIIVLIVFLTIIFLFTPVFAYDTHTAHPNLTAQAVDLFNMHFGNRVSEANKKFMMNGAIAEDTPIRWMNHFYEPNTGQGLLGFQTAKSWGQSKDTQKLYAKGDQSWQTAIDEFVNNNNEKAFIALGHFLHLIEDMTVPAHTRLDIHVFNGGDPYEQWVKNNYKMEQFIEPTVSKSLNNAFDYLALFSNKNFLSEDTINYDKIKESKIIIVNSYDGEISQCIEGKINEISFCLVKYKKDGFGSVEYSFGNVVNSDYFSILAPKAISYGAGIIKLFFDTAEPLKEKKQAENNKLLQNLINYAQNIFFTPAFAQTNNTEQLLRLALVTAPAQTPNAQPTPTTKPTAPTTTPKNIISTTTTISPQLPLQNLMPDEQWPAFLPEIYPKEHITAEPIQPTESPVLLPLYSYHIPSYTKTAPKLPPVIIALPTPPQVPILDRIFSSLIFTSSSPTNIFGECGADTAQINLYRAIAPASSTAGMELLQTHSVSSSAWQTNAPLQYGNNLFYFTAQNNAGLSSELSEPTSIVLDDQPPEVFFESITVTSTEESTQIELTFLANDTFSDEICFDLQVATNTSHYQSEVLNCANFSQFVYEADYTGEIHFYLRAKDEFGNYSEWITTSTVILPTNYQYNYLNGKQTAPEVVLTKEGSPYILRQYVVPVRKVLRIEPGVVIKAETRRSGLNADGKIFALGTAEEPIVFTTVQDRSFATKKLNTPNLGLARAPQAKDWAGLAFYWGEAIFDHAIIRYAGTDHLYPCLATTMVIICDYNSEALFLNYSKIEIKNSIIENASLGMMSSYSTDLIIKDTVIDGLAGGQKADYGIRAVNGTIKLDNVVFKNLKTGIEAGYIAPAITRQNMTIENFIDVDNPWLPETLISL
jgi:hypothetical protein